MSVINIILLADINRLWVHNTNEIHLNKKEKPLHITCDNVISVKCQWNKKKIDNLTQSLQKKNRE